MQLQIQPKFVATSFSCTILKLLHFTRFQIESGLSLEEQKPKLMKSSEQKIFVSPCTKCGVAQYVTCSSSFLSLLLISVFKGLNNVINFVSNLSTVEWYIKLTPR